MRLALIAACVGLVAGCYCSHERVSDADAAPSPTDAAAPSSCRVACEPVEHLATLDVSSPETEALTAIAIDGERIAILGRRRSDEHEGFVHVVTTFDLASRTVVGTGATRELWSAIALAPGSVAVDPEGTRVLGLTTDAIATRFPAQADVGVASFALAGALTSEATGLASLPFVFEPCGCPLRVAMPWRGPHAAVVSLEGETMWLTRLGLDGPPATSEHVELAHFDGAPPRSTPISADLWPDGRVVAVAGGYASGLEPRDAVFVAEREGGVTSVLLPGERFDPPPSVVAIEGGAAIFRFVSDPFDLEESALRAEVRDELGEPIDGAPVRTIAGLVPLASATFRRDDGAGMVWVEPDQGLRVLPPPGSGTAPTWDACAATDSSPVATLDPPIVTAPSLGGRSLLAVGIPGTADVAVAALTITRDPYGVALEIFRLPGCRLDD